MNINTKLITMPSVEKKEMAEKKVVCFLCVTLFLFLPGCKKGIQKGNQIYRLIDHLKEENVVRKSSLFLTLESGEEEKECYPLQSSPLLDSGAGEKASGLKIKLQMGGVSLNAIFAPPVSEYSYILPFPQNAVLDFGLGITQDENSEKVVENKDGGVNFLISMEMNGRKKTLFQKYIRFSSLKGESDFSFSRYKIELPPVSQEVRLSLMTRGEEGAFPSGIILLSMFLKRKDVMLSSYLSTH